jgi:hypothetical protein
VLHRPLAVSIFVTCAALRFLGTEFTNDHFDRISRGRQILVAGEMPFRDFFDPGYFLMVYASAAVQWLFGDNLLGEGLLSAVMIACGVTFTFVLAARASGSTVVALLLCLLVVATEPRGYSYDKVFFFPLGLLLCWRYVDDPRWRNLLLLSGCALVAFLFRYDSGLYIGLASFVAIAGRHWGDTRRLLRHASFFSLIGLVLVTPFLVVLQINGGTVEYFRDVARYARREREATRVPWLPSIAFNDLGSLLALESGPLREPLRKLPRINVRWGRGVDAEQQEALERKHRLADALRDPSDPRDRTWSYELLEGSPQSLAALLNDPAVEDTANVDQVTDAADRSALVSAWERLPWPRLRFSSSATAATWLYYVLVLLPPSALLVLVARRIDPPSAAPWLPHEAPKILAGIVMLFLAGLFLLRDPLQVRLGDVATPAAVLGAWLLRAALPTRGVPARMRPTKPKGESGEAVDAASRLRSAARTVSFAAMAVLVLGVTTAGVATVSTLGRVLDPDGIIARAFDLPTQLAMTASRLAFSPPARYGEAHDLAGGQALSRYVNRCTVATDRVLATWFAPEIPFYSGRAFAAGQVVFVHGHWSTEEDQRKSVHRLARQRTPIILMDMRNYDRFAKAYPLIDQYLSDYYSVAAESGFGDHDSTYRVLVDSRLTPTGTYERWSLPCFA